MNLVMPFNQIFLVYFVIDAFFFQPSFMVNMVLLFSQDYLWWNLSLKSKLKKKKKKHHQQKIIFCWIISICTKKSGMTFQPKFFLVNFVTGSIFSALFYDEVGVTSYLCFVVSLVLLFSLGIWWIWCHILPSFMVIPFYRTF